MTPLHQPHARRTGLLRASALVALFAAAGVLPRPAWAANPPAFNRDVRPILAENCFACHGPDKAARKGDLRLDLRDEALKSKAFVPGKPDESAVVERIFSSNARKQMPPHKTNKKLTAAQKDILRKWIAAGAEYEPHWAFIPPKRPALPALKNKKWARNGIDHFTLAEMEKRGLTPAPEADRHTLARRASLDLTGLPPTTEEVQRFVNDRSPTAYEQYVDRLMNKQQWGEHRGRYWLDAARYADTHGIHFDNFREMWSYRDWVINAFNRNQRFDQFTIEQLAGDLLPNATLDQKIASGFNRCNITSNEGGLIPEEYLVLYTRDRTETVAQVWLGLTAGCAVCHSHKFDPLSQKEFYGLAAFFNNTTQGAMDGNIKDTPPIITIPRTEDRPRWDALVKEITAKRAQVESSRKAARARFDRWAPTAKQDDIVSAIPTNSLHLHAGLNEGKGNTVALTVDGKARSLVVPAPLTWGPGHLSAKALLSRPGGVVTIPDAGDFEKDKGFSFGAWVRIPTNRATGAVFARMDEGSAHRGWDLWVENGRFGTHIINKWPESAIKVVAGPRVKAGTWNHVFVSYDGSGKVEGVQIYLNGALQNDRSITANSLKGTIRTKVPFKVAQRSTGQRVDGVLVQDVRLYGRALAGVEVTRVARTARAATLVSKPAAARTPAENNELFDWWISAEDTAYQSAVASLEHLAREESAIRARGTIAHITVERPDKPIAYTLFRGDYDKRRDKVEASTPRILGAMPADLPRNRLGLAQWLMRPEHPLTARVTVNRFWQELFGTGIVRTSGDFGVTGDAPTHPELLDFLAVEFREKGWDVKRFYKMMVTSATYRQAATVTPEKREKDPFNTWLSRGPRFRMDAEMVRDYALFASGLLVPRIGGPSVRPYQPEGVWEAVAMIGSNTRDYRRDSGAALYRRSMYTIWKRSAPPASMEIFNAPNREFCVVRRERTNTPLQALVTLNDVQFVEAARTLAEKALKDGGARAETKIDFLAQRILARSLRAEEMKVVQDLSTDLLAHYGKQPAEANKLIGYGESKADPALDAGKLAGWTMLVNSLLNLDEVLNK